MCKVRVESERLNASLDLEPRADFLSCLMTAAIAALPAFLEAFMTCLAGGSTPGDYQPGDRKRC